MLETVKRYGKSLIRIFLHVFAEQKSCHYRRMSLVLCMLFCCTISFAQGGIFNTVNPALTPTAAALGKYVEVPVSLYTGKAQVGVPLYALDAGGISIPVSINYNTEGVKVLDIPGTMVQDGRWIVEA